MHAKVVFNPNIPIFQPNCAEGLHFSAFDICSNGAWDMHIRTLLDNGRRKLNRLHKVISNKNINLSEYRPLLLSVIRLTVWVTKKFPFFETR